LTQAIPELPDPFSATCSFCEHKARYEKSSIRYLWGTPNGDGFGSVRTKSAIPSWQMLGVFALIIILVIVVGLTKGGGDAFSRFIHFWGS
jgi:hypothetical protein